MPVLPWKARQHTLLTSVSEARSARASCIPLPLQNGKEVLRGIPYFQTEVFFLSGVWEHCFLEKQNNRG